MFDDVKKEPDDIFSESDKTAPQVASPTEAPVASAQAPVTKMAGRMASPRRSFPWKPTLLIVGILVMVGAAFYLSMKILSSSTPVTPQPPAEKVDQVEEVDKVDKESSVSADEAAPVVEEEKPSTADRDKDGLTDAEEKELGTSSRAADTDGDGLFDFEEVRTWETDPLNPDTDGDGYLDGEEVSGGYNPNGEGKLLEPPTESD
ncbi:hypothetical protein HZA87_06150 [Candidatus Uhrbacteria bacterium]|nr:hypothetical protein [Candidatus Uhrbacteria bacterium]